LVEQGITLSKAVRLSPYVRLIRPQQWTKNAIVFAGVLFGGQIGEPEAMARAALAFVAFCLVSSAVYVFNDWHDRDEDRLHPTKCWRPIAARQVTPGAALALAVGLLGLALSVSFWVSPQVATVVGAYACLMVAYTLWLRRAAILDILAIAGGFVLRAWAGAVAVDVPLSQWLFLCTMLLALFLGLGKRRHELRVLRDDIAHHRPSLGAYGKLDLDRVIVAVAIVTALGYALYALTIPDYGRSLSMVITVPFVIAGIGRYLYLILRCNLGGSPEILLLRDRPLFVSIILWVLTVGLVLTS
jgi:4-hydroxybenzoate polyprenyltransferase